MNIYGLWHSEFFLEIENNFWEKIKILSDVWLSNYAFWDFMERYPRLKIDFAKLDKIDFIFLSHSHCDHFDPYTLVEIFKHQNPEIILPETIIYLKDILEKYLPNVKITILKDRENTSLKWLNFYWIVFRHTSSTNEDDVMTLAVNSETEICYIEVDTAIPETEDIFEELNWIFTKKNFSSICHISTRNELWGIFWSLDAQNSKERAEKIKNYKETRIEETEWQYAKYDEWFEEYADLSKLKNYCKIFNGQWIAYPKILWTEFDEIFIPLSLEEITKIEKETAKNYWRKMPIKALLPWEKLVIENWKIILNKKIDLKINNWIEIILDRNFTFNKKSQNFREIKSQPLNPKKIDENNLKSKILETLNNKFLSYQIWSIENPLRELVLRSPNKKYVIAVKFLDWNWEKNITFFSYNFQNMRFKISKKETHYNEIYWANDLQDLFDWKQEMFSTFLHKLEKWKPLFFWTCLWMPLIASEIVKKKFDFHFKNACEWKKVDEFCEEILRRFK